MRGSILVSLLAIFSITIAQECGPKGGNKKCSGTQCCSQYGWCGTSSAYCEVSNGCQSGFGRCSGVTNNPSTPVGTSTNKCGAVNGGLICAPGYCCSPHGFCGKSAAYCGNGCDPKYGACSGSPTPSSAPISKNARCGASFNGQTCKGSAYGSCCSKAGWCGTTGDHCKVSSGCQSTFGTCEGVSSVVSSTSVRSSTVASSSTVQSSSLISSTIRSLSSVTPYSSVLSSSIVQSVSNASPSSSPSIASWQSTSSSSSRSEASSSYSSLSQTSAETSPSSSAISSLASSGFMASSTSASSEASPSPSAPIMLYPRRDPSIDRSKSNNLTPASPLTLFYSENSPGTYTMLIKAIFSSPDKAVLLENIGTIDAVTCSPDRLLVDFTDVASADLAKSWPAGTILITLSDGCNPADERGVYVISKSGVTPPTRLRRTRAAGNLVAFSVSTSTLKSVVDELDISYGKLISGANGEQQTSFTTTATSYFTHSKMGTLTSSVFVTTITPTVITETLTSSVAATPVSASSVASSATQSAPSVDSSDAPLSPQAQAIMEELSKGLPAPGPDGTITIPIKKGSDEPLPPQTMEPAPYNPDPAYQAQLQEAMAADHLDSTETMLDSAVNDVADQESNVPVDSPVKLYTSEYAGTSDEVYDNAKDVVVTSTSDKKKRNVPARVASALAPRAAMKSTDIDARSTRHYLNKRDGWDTFFDVMGDDLVGEICEICGAIAAGKDLYDGLKCLFGKCPSPPQVTITMLEAQIQKYYLSYSSQLSKGGAIYQDSKATVLCESCYLKLSTISVEGAIRVMPKQMHVKEDFVISAKVTIAQTHEAAAVYNIRVKGAGSGSFDRSIATVPMKDLSTPGVVTISAVFMYSLGLTYDTAQELDVQAGAIFNLKDAAVDVDIKDQSMSNPRNWQGSAQVTYPKLTKPGRVVLSPFIKTDYQISLTIFGQYFKNAIVVTTQNNMAFDAEVLTTAQQVSKRSGEGQRPNQEIRDVEELQVSKRAWFGNVLARVKAIVEAARAAAAAAAAAQNQPPPPPPPACNAGSMKLGASLQSKNQIVIAGKPNNLYDQPYKFGSQCIPFDAPAGNIVPNVASLPSSTPVIIPSSSAVRTSSTIRISSSAAPVRSSLPPLSSASPIAVQSSPAASASASCTNQASGFYPPAGSSCFKIVGRGIPSIEGKYMNAQSVNPTIGWQNLPASVFYLDNSGYMYEAFRGGVLATAYTGGSAWLQFLTPQSLGSTPRATCTKDNGSKKLNCFQTNTDIIAISTRFSSDDSRQTIPMWGLADRNFQPIGLFYEETDCPAACVSSTPAITPTSSPVRVSSAPASVQPTPSVNAQCSNSLSWTAPAGSTCFTLTGHGPSHVEGQLLGMSAGYSSPAFSWAGFNPATFAIDAEGSVWVASETGNGWRMSTLPIDNYSPWLSFFPPTGDYQGKPFDRSSCTLSRSDGQLKCTAKGFSTWYVAPRKEFYSAEDTRSGMPIFGVANAPWVSMTMTFNEVSCPVKCGATPSPSLTVPSSTPAVVVPSWSRVVSSPTPSASAPAVAQEMQPCGGFSPGGNFAISGSTYSVHCGVTGSAPVSRIDVVFMPTFRACMSSCNLTTGCRAVMFREIAPVNGGYQCTRYSSLGLPQDDGFDWEGTFDVAFKVRGTTGGT